MKECGLTWNTALLLGFGLTQAADELGPGNHANVVDLGEGRKAIVIVTVPRPPQREDLEP